MIGDVDSLFIDTNVLVYATFEQSPFHQIARSSLAQAVANGAALWVSRQVLREYAAVVTRPQVAATPVSTTQAAQHITAFVEQFRVADEDASVTLQLQAIMRSVNLAGKQIHDANIVATMRVIGVNQLLTHNWDDFKRFSHLITVIPLIPVPLADA